VTYDPALGGLLAFGGSVRPGSAGLNQTWAFVGGAWTALHPAQSPPGRSASALAYDPSLRAMVLFGGRGATVPNSTWKFNGRNWVNVTTAVAPVSGSPELAYDRPCGCLLMAGGLSSVTGRSSNVTWNLSGKSWSVETSGSGPTLRVDQFALGFDVTSGRLLLYLTGPKQGATWWLAV
jgi:hypothetical protein